MDWINNVLETVKQQYAGYGYWIVFFAALLENTVVLGWILPGGTFVLLGAIYAASGTLNIGWVILLGWLGVFLGTCIDYWIGRLGLHNLIEKTFLRKYLLEHQQTAEKFLMQRGGLAISLSYFVGHMRTVIALTSGTVKFPFGKYLLYQAPASFVWNAAYCSLGYFLGGSVESLEGILTTIAIITVVLAMVGYIGYNLKLKLETPEPEKARPEQVANPPLEDPK